MHRTLGILRQNMLQGNLKSTGWTCKKFYDHEHKSIQEVFHQQRIAGYFQYSKNKDKKCKNVKLWHLTISPTAPLIR